MPKRILLTGMSGVGKSTIINAMRNRGYRAVDTDDVGWVILRDDGERIWGEARMQALLSSVEDDEVLFVSGTVINQGQFYNQFDRVILLSAPPTVIRERLQTRTNNPYGKHPDEWAEIQENIDIVEPLLRKRADIEIDTSIALDKVLTKIETYLRSIDDDSNE